MAAKTDLVVARVKAAIVQKQLTAVVAFKSGAWNHVKYAVGAVAEVGGIAAAPHLEGIDIFWVKLRTNIAANIGVGHRHAVNEPTYLMSAPDVKLVMHHVGAGNEICDHLQAVAAVSARAGGNVVAADERFTAGRLRILQGSHVGDINGFARGCDAELKMYIAHIAGVDDDALRLGSKAFAGHFYGVLADRYRLQKKLAGTVGSDGLLPV